MFPRNTFSKESLRKWEIGTYLIWQQKLKQSSLLKFPVRLLKKPVTGAFLVKAFCENFWWSFLCGVSYQVTVSRNLIDFSFWWPIRLLNTDFSWWYFVKTKFSTGMLHMISLSNKIWLTFLSEGPSNCWPQEFLQKAFHGNLIEISFLEAHWISGYVGSCESISWELYYDAIQTSHGIVIFNALFIWLKIVAVSGWNSNFQISCP